MGLATQRQGDLDSLGSSRPFRQYFEGKRICTARLSLIEITAIVLSTTNGCVMSAILPLIVKDRFRIPINKYLEDFKKCISLSYLIYVLCEGGLFRLNFLVGLDVEGHNNLIWVLGHKRMCLRYVDSLEHAHIRQFVLKVRKLERARGQPDFHSQNFQLERNPLTLAVDLVKSVPL